MTTSAITAAVRTLLILPFIFSHIIARSEALPAHGTAQLLTMEQHDINDLPPCNPTLRYRAFVIDNKAATFFYCSEKSKWEKVDTSRPKKWSEENYYECSLKRMIGLTQYNVSLLSHFLPAGHLNFCTIEQVTSPQKSRETQMGWFFPKGTKISGFEKIHSCVVSIQDRYIIVSKAGDNVPDGYNIGYSLTIDPSKCEK